LSVLDQLRQDFTSNENLSVLMQIDGELSLEEEPKKKKVTFNDTMSEDTSEHTGVFLTQFLSGSKGFDLVKLKRFFPDRDLTLKEEFNARWRRIIANLEILKEITPFEGIWEYTTFEIPFPRLFGTLSTLYYKSLSQVFLKPMINESHANILKKAIDVQIHRQDDENLYNFLFLFVKFNVPFPDERYLIKILRQFPKNNKIAQLTYICLQSCELDIKTTDFLYSEILKTQGMIELNEFNVDLLTCLNFKPSRFGSTLIGRLPWSMSSLIYVNSLLALKTQPNVTLLESCKKFFWNYQSEMMEVMNLDLQKNAKSQFYCLLFFYQLTRFGVIAFDKIMVRSLFRQWNSMLSLSTEEGELFPIILDGIKCLIKMIILMMDIPQGVSSRNVNYVLENSSETTRTLELAMEKLMNIQSGELEIKRNVGELLLNYLVVTGVHLKKEERKSVQRLDFRAWNDKMGNSLSDLMRNHLAKLYRTVYASDGLE
jgi:hypothetical protein